MAPSRDSSPTDPGLGSMLLGYFLLGLQPLPVAWLATRGLSPAATVFSRFGFAAVGLTLICLSRRKGLRTHNPRLLFLRGLFGGTAVMLYFYSIQHAGAARGTLLNYTYPIWANLISCMLGTKVEKSFWATLFLAVVGVWLVVLPPEGWGTRSIGRGEWAGLASAICAGAAVLTIKKLRATDDSLTIIASFSACGLLFSAPFTDFDESWESVQSPTVAIAALSVGALSFFGHILFTRGYRGVSLSQGTLLSSFVPIVATVGGLVVLKEPASPHFFLGAALVASAVLLALRPSRNATA